MNAIPAPRTRARSSAIWTLRVLLALLFFVAGVMKLASQPTMVAEFNQVGLGQWFRYFIGGLEIAGSVALLIPSVSIFGAAALLLVDAGAFVAQISILQVDWVHPIVIGAALVLLIHLLLSPSLARVPPRAT